MKNKKTKDSIDKHSGDYINILKSVPENRFRYLIPKYILPKKKSSILDIGCGYALLAKIFKNYDVNYFGVDFSSDFINEAKLFIKTNNLIKASVFCDDVNNFCKNTKKKFDLLTLFDFSEHVDDKDLIKILNSLHKVMHKDSILYIYTPNLNFFLERLKDIGLIKQFEQHIAVRNKRMYQQDIINKTKFKSSAVNFHHLKHFNILRYFHYFTFIPINFVREIFQAKILIEIKK